MLEKLKAEIGPLIVWCVSVCAVTVLVGMGKVKPETLEYLLFGLAGYAGALRSPKDQTPAPPKEGL